MSRSFPQHAQNPEYNRTVPAVKEVSHSLFPCSDWICHNQVSITPLHNSKPDILLFTSHLLLQEPMLTYGKKGMASFQVYEAETRSPPIQMEICPTSFFSKILQHAHNPK